MTTEEQYSKMNHSAMRYLRFQKAEKHITNLDISKLTGIPSNSVGRMLKGDHSPTLINFTKLCDAIGVSWSEVENKLWK